MDTCMFIKMTYRPKGPGAIYDCFVCCITYSAVKYSHATIIKYLLTCLLIQNNSQSETF